MTKKDYIKLAQALKDSKPNQYVPREIAVYEHVQDWQYPTKLQAWQNTVMQIVETLRLDNPQFNKARFLHACGYTQQEG